MLSQSEIIENFKKIREQIAQAESNASRPSGSVSLCAVSKFHPIDAIYDAMQANQFLFGENRVQEAYLKFTEIANDKTIAAVPQLHIIGSLQLNKVNHAVQIASCIQSIDRVELLKEIEKQCAKQNKTVSVMFEYHTGEESKSGYKTYDELCETLSLCKENAFPHIVPNGFMTMAPFTEDERILHASFAKLRTVSEAAQKQFPELSLSELSMGMSNDFKIAIEEGSTMVRIGTALFGPREQ